MIKVSTDWALVESNLIHKCSKLLYGRDVKRMIKNLQKEIKELSKAEIDARRGKSQRARDLLIKINHDIELVEEYLLVAALIG